MKFVNCELIDCIITNQNPINYIDDYKDVKINGFTIRAGKKLIIQKGHLIKCELRGRYDYVEFCPSFCKDVLIADDFLFKEGIVKIDCLVWGGLILGNNINKFIASLMMANQYGNIDFLNFEEIKKWIKILDKYFRRVECQQEALSKKN